MAVSISSTHLGVAAAAVAYDAPHSRLAVADRGGRLAVFRRDGDSRDWLLASNFSLPPGTAQLNRLAWAPSEMGAVLAGGAADGSLWVWAQTPEAAPPPSYGDGSSAAAAEDAAADGEGEEEGAPGSWQLRARFADSSLSVQALAFAPPELGPLLAAAYADGHVRFYAADAPLAAKAWRLEADLRACPGGGACTSLSWREHSPGLPPLLAVGTATGELAAGDHLPTNPVGMKRGTLFMLMS